MVKQSALRSAGCFVLLATLSACAGSGAGPDDSGLSYRVSVPDSREIALVAPSGPLATIAGVEAAAERQTGCRAVAIARLYEATNQDRRAPLPAKLYRGFGGQLPVKLTCRT